MTLSTLASAPVCTAEGDDAATGPERRQGLITLGLLATVVVLDQATKWWAWRNASEAIINSGGTWLIGAPVSGLFSGPVSGPLLDLLNIGLLSLAGFVLVRRPRRALILVTEALMIAGWSSNLLDRLGMHTVTAPGSIRGAVDFIPLGPACWNVADFVIMGATALSLVAVCARGGRRGRPAAAIRPVTPMPSLRAWAPRRTWVAAAGFVVAVVAVMLSVPAAIQAESDVGVESSGQASAVAAPHA
jgi:lipoprotein signal peptidase